MISKSIMIKLLLLVVACALVGCANRDRQPVYVASEEVPSIRVPSGLSEPSFRAAYRVPGVYLPELAAVGDEARPPRVLPSAEAEASRSHIRFGPSGLFLAVDDEADSVWRRLSFALNRGGMSVRNVDESTRRYYFRFDHDPIEVNRTGLARLAVWRGSTVLNYSGQYRADVHADGDKARINLFHSDGNMVDMETAEFVLSVLRERLG